MRRLISGVVLVVSMVGGLSAAPADATEIGHEGCTPGYWKTHTDSWLETEGGNPIPTTALFSTKFYPGQTGPMPTGALTGKTFLQALQGGGGPGVAGAELILGRAATAAYLNAANEGLGYPWRRSGPGLDGRPALLPTVRDAINSRDRDTMLDLAARLDADNNLGCPLS